MTGAFESLGGNSHDDMFTNVTEERIAHTYLLYGGQGVGKTYTALTSEQEPIFVIDTEMRTDLTATEKFADKDIRVYEPVEINFDDVDPDNPLEDAIDIPATLDNINNAVIGLVNGCRDGEIEGGTVVFDSVTDLWDWVMEAGKLRLMEANEVDEATFRLENQMDWGGIKSRHYKILTALRVLTKKYNMDVILTAREKEKPDYADGGGEHYIKCENSVPFMSGVNIRFTREVRKGQTRHIANFKKIGANNQPDKELIDPTFEEIRQTVDSGEIDQDEDEDEDDSGF
ncbi:MAG: AAA family ATPase [Halopenitus sp.]